MTTVAITGATGFIGSALSRHLSEHGRAVRAIRRDDLPAPALDCVSVVVHCAAIAHSKGVSDADMLAADYHLPVELALHAHKAGVRRFVFVSSTHAVAGSGGTLTEDMQHDPIGTYGKAKAMAELKLLDRLTMPPDFEIVVLRLPLVYGPNVRGNLRALVSLCAKPVPLPFGLAANRRTLASLSNVASALAFLSDAPAAKVAGRVFHVCDSAPISTRDLVTRIRAVMGMRPMLLPVPTSVAKMALRAIGKGAMAEQLFGDLLVDCSALKAAGWHPVNSDDLARMVAAHGQ